MREKEIEQKLVKAVKAIGGLAPKFVSPSFNGMADRILLLDGGKMAFAEIKAPGEKMRPLQLRRKMQLEKLGFAVYCIDSVEKIESVLKEVMADEVHPT